MNKKALDFLSNFSYTIISNIISLVISTLVVLIIPRLVGVEEYGYWQLYLFYSSYVGFLHFGWIDGIYLRYGGKTYDELDKTKFFSQFHMLTISQIFISVLLVVTTLLFSYGEDKRFILQMTAICLVLSNVRNMLNFILQSTSRIKEFARITMLDRISYVILIIGFILLGVRDYRIMIIADLLGKTISLIYAMVLCKEIVFRRISTFALTVGETITNIAVGIKLMISTIASTLVIGVVRFGIERVWSVVVFAKVSLSLSVSNLLMIFINAVGIIMYPILRRTDPTKLPKLYIVMRTLLMVAMFALLIMYYPIRYFLSSWLPAYEESLAYLALLFPISIYEGNMALLVNTYLKTLRKEKEMLRINLITLVFSLILTLITTYGMKNLNYAIISIPILLAVRSFLSEMYLAKLMNISIKKDAIMEFILTGVFMFTGWMIFSWMGVLLYLVVYILYVLYKWKEIRMSIQFLKTYMKS